MFYYTLHQHIYYYTSTLKHLLLYIYIKTCITTHCINTCSITPLCQHISYYTFTSMHVLLHIASTRVLLHIASTDLLLCIYINTFTITDLHQHIYYYTFGSTHFLLHIYINTFGYKFHKVTHLYTLRFFNYKKYKVHGYFLIV